MYDQRTNYTTVIKIDESDLRDACRWHNSRFGKNAVGESVFVTYLCGWFHSHPKAMKDVI